MIYQEKAGTAYVNYEVYDQLWRAGNDYDMRLIGQDEFIARVRATGLPIEKMMYRLTDIKVDRAATTVRFVEGK